MSAAQDQGYPKDEAIAWRIRFMAYVCGNMHNMDTSLTDDESLGFMLVLQDIANMIDPPSEKDGAE
jgi:hypothetical protein